ncbi:MAG: ComEC/Rec2 family competence protein [Candidatus Desulfofervidus auxilii]|nr:ComEC/Rec2 family competence protein [Candidatus Desulfofervidus auxilii]
MKGWLNSHPLIFFLPFYCLGLIIGGNWPFVKLFLFLFLFNSILLFFFRSRYILAIFFIFLGTFWQSLFFQPPPITKFVNKKITLKGKVIHIIDKKRFILDDIFVKEKKIKGKILLKIYQNINLSLGHIIEVKGKLKLIKSPNNPGTYDYAREWKRKGVWVRINTGRINIVGYEKPWFWSYILEKFRRKIRTFLFKHLSQPIRGIYCALLLGEKQNLLPHIRDIFSFTGTSHLLAISGLHLGMIMGLFYTLFWYILSRSERLLLYFQLKKLSAFLAIFPSFFYASLAHFSPATTRSFFMLLLFWWLYFSRRLKNTWIFLVTAAWIMLLFNPTLIYSISFQLSFIALASILYFIPKFSKTHHWLKSEKRLLHYFILCFYGSLAAWLGTLPIVMHYFGHFSLIAPFLNLIAIPLIGFIVLPLGFLSLFFLPFSETIASFFIKIGGLALKILILFLQKIANIPGTHFWLFIPTWLEVIFLYILLFNFFRPRYLILTFISLFLLEMIFYFSAKPKGFEVSFFDVGEGTSIFLYFPKGKTMLIGGGGSRSDYDPGRHIIARALWTKRIYKIDYLVLPTPHYRYLKGLKFIANHFHPKVLWINGFKSIDKDYLELINLCKKKHVSVIFPKTQEIDGVKIKILYPKKEAVTLKDSLFIYCIYNKVSFLFPFYLKRRILNQYTSKIDVLLAPNFGNKKANSLKFINLAKPKYVVFSGRYPDEEIIKNYIMVGSQIFITSKHGMISFVTDGKYLKNIKLDRKNLI